MIFKNHPAIVGVGWVSCFGSHLSLAVAAQANGLSRLQCIPMQITGESVTVSKTGLEFPDEEAFADPLARMITFLAEAVEDAVKFLNLGNFKGLAPCPAWLAFPMGATWLPNHAESVFRNVLSGAAEPLVIVPKPMPKSGLGRVTGLAMLAEASMAISRGETEMALVAAADSQIGFASIAQLASEGKLIGEHTLGGMIPSEGAVCIVLASESLRKHRGWEGLGRVCSSGVGKEPSAVPHPCKGQGLSEALQQALEGLPPSEHVSDWACDLNGERPLASEWAFTVPKIAGPLEDPARLYTPATSQGDLGAATGLALVAMSLEKASRTMDRESYSMVWGSAPGAERHAMLLRTAPATRLMEDRLQANPGPSEHNVFQSTNRTVTAELITRAAFLWNQRHALQEQIEFEKSWRCLAGIEGQLEHIASVLVSEKVFVSQQLTKAIDEGKPGEVYLWLRIQGQSPHRWEEAVSLLAPRTGQDPRMDWAMLEAIEHGAASWDELKDRIALLLRRPDELGDLGVVLAARHRVEVSRERLATAIGRSQYGNKAQWALVLANLGSSSHGIQLQAWLASSPPIEQGTIASAWIRLCGRVALADLWGKAQLPWIPPRVILNGRKPQDVLAMSNDFQGNSSYCHALGLLGDPACFEVLLPRLEGHGDAEAASAAMEIISGAEIHEPGADPACLHGRWKKWLKDKSKQFPVGKSFRLGKTPNAKTTLECLCRPNLARGLRRIFLDELAISYHLPLGLSVDMLVRHQEQILDSAMKGAERS